SSSRWAPVDSSSSAICCSMWLGAGSISKRPSTTARLAPTRTRVGSARTLESRCRLVTTIVLPAPVSPVSTVSPPWKRAYASEITPRLSIRISASISELPSPPALHRKFELAHHPIREGCRIQPHPADRIASSHHLEPGTGRDVDDAAPVAEDHPVVAAGEGFDRDARLGAGHQRAREQCVGVARDHQ